MKLLRCEVGRAHADGVLCSANVPRPSGSSFISLRRAHHRREPSRRWFISGQRHTAFPVPRAPGGPRSEVKEEAKPGDMSGGGHPVPSARAPNMTPHPHPNKT